MGKVRKLSVAGITCLAVTTQETNGWRAAGFFDRHTVIVESFATENEAVLAWRLAALSRGPEGDEPAASRAGVI